MSKLPVYFFFVLIAAYFLYIVFFTPAIDKLITRFRLSRKITTVKALADEVHLAAANHQKDLLAQQFETDLQLDEMASVHHPLLQARTSTEARASASPPSENPN